ncbi:MAG: hypothetical protein JW797_00305 [Bradymonadales bacterium]|nr:hypothetical protein [Bradymonadales bacterium]
MVKLTPVQVVRQRFGSKAELSKLLLPLVDRDDGMEEAEFERRIKTASNRQLLRMYQVTQKIKRRFGSKEGLVDAIVRIKFPNGNADYRAKLLRQRQTRLLDLYRSLR